MPLGFCNWDPYCELEALCDNVLEKLSLILMMTLQQEMNNLEVQ